MGKIKSWAYEQAEARVDQTAQALKDGICTKQEAIEYILQIDNVALLGIDQDNVGEYLDTEVAHA